MAYGAVDVWENVELEAQNHLTEWLHAKDRVDYQNWNRIVEAYVVLLDNLTDHVWIPFQQKLQLDRVFVSSVQWDILGALIGKQLHPERT